MTRRARFVCCLVALGLLAVSPAGARDGTRPLAASATATPLSAGVGGAGESPRAGTATPGRGSGRMVVVVGGRFFMGCNETLDTECFDVEMPGRTVEVGTFEIDKTEVTVGDYARCVSAGTCSGEGLTMPFYDGQDQPEFAEFCNWQRAGRESHPMNCVNWDQAVAYCEWAGKRLPTEAEWEKAARGTDGRKYPWGNAGYGGGRKVANIADESAGRRFPEWPIAAGYDDHYVGTAPVGSFPMGESPAGALDMIGNVWEWTADPFEGGRSFRGGSWDAEPRSARASTRRKRDADRRGPGVGFRCVR